jgi:hypothetical protein
MNSLYRDTGIIAGYRHLMELSSAASQSPEQSGLEGAAYEAFFASLVERVYASLQHVSTQPLPALQFHAWHGEADRAAYRDANKIFADPRGLHVGLSWVFDQLDVPILVLTAYLMENYLSRVGAPVTVVDPADFPAEALRLYSTPRVPDRDVQDGYRKRPFQGVMEHLQAARMAGTDSDRRPVTCAIAMPMLDYSDFSTHFDAGASIAEYLDPDEGAYLLRLHLQLLLDGLYFLLAHEAAHHQLGHFEHRGAPATQIRRLEAAADAAALALMRRVPGFQPRSLIVLFSACKHKEPDSSPGPVDHPLAQNRLIILAEALLEGPGGNALRTDVNAGLALLASSPERWPFTFGWPDEAPEDVDVPISSYTDMDYAVHVMVYLERSPRHAMTENPSAENAFLLAHVAYKILFEVRDRIDVENVHSWCGAGYHPTIRPEDLYVRSGDGKVFTRLELVFPAPAEFCLMWPHAEFAIKNVTLLTRPPDTRAREEGRNAVRFFYDPIEIDLDTYLEALGPSAPGQLLIFRLLVAARRYHDYDRYVQSIRIYQWLYERARESLIYDDLVKLTAQLLDADRYTEAAEVARWAIGPGRVPRPGFHYVLALDHDRREDALAAFEEAFLEMGAFGKYGEMFDDARSLCGSVASAATGPVADALRAFMTRANAAGQMLERGEREAALADFRSGRDGLAAARRHSPRDFVFLRQLLSDAALEIAKLDAAEMEAAADAARAVLALRDDFVPALMNLANIARLQGDSAAAEALWRRAHGIAPFHDIVFDIREEFQYGVQ